jgi:hypothetical protein
LAFRVTFLRDGVPASSMTFDELLRTDIVGYILSNGRRARRWRSGPLPTYQGGSSELIPPSPYHPVAGTASPAVGGTTEPPDAYLGGRYRRVRQGEAEGGEMTAAKKFSKERFAEIAALSERLLTASAFDAVERVTAPVFRKKPEEVFPTLEAKLAATISDDDLDDLIAYYELNYERARKPMMRLSWKQSREMVEAIKRRRERPN